MHAAALVLSLAAVTVDTGYEPDGQGGIRYLVHVPPAQLEQLRRTGELTSSIDPRLQGRVTEVVIRITDETPKRDERLLVATDSQRIQQPALPASALAGSPASVSGAVLKPADDALGGYVLPPGAPVPGTGNPQQTGLVMPPGDNSGNFGPATSSNVMRDPNAAGMVMPPGSSPVVPPPNVFVGPPPDLRGASPSSGGVFPPGTYPSVGTSGVAGPSAFPTAAPSANNWQIENSSAFPSTDPVPSRGVASTSVMPPGAPPRYPTNPPPSVMPSGPAFGSQQPVRGGQPETFGQAPMSPLYASRTQANGGFGGVGSNAMTSNVGPPPVYGGAGNGGTDPYSPNNFPNQWAASASQPPYGAMTSSQAFQQAVAAEAAAQRTAERSRPDASAETTERTAAGGAAAKRGTQPFNQKFLNGMLLLSLVINAYMVMVTYKLYLRYRHLIINIRGVATAA